jgi:hypothetical protein
VSVVGRSVLAMTTRPIDHARLTEVAERYFATPVPRTAAEQIAYQRLEVELIDAMGLTRAEFDRMADATRDRHLRRRRAS